MNECFFMGNLTRDPKLIPTKNNNNVVSFGIATNRWYKRTNGETANEATFIELEAWDSGARRIFEMFKKGDPILVEASAKNPVRTDKDGNERKQIVFRVNKFWPINRKEKHVEEEDSVE